MPAYVLDSYALLAYFNSESGGQQIIALLEAAQDQTADLFASLINVGEIYYLIYRRLGESKAQEMLRLLRSLPVKLCEASESRILSAAVRSPRPIEAKHNRQFIPYLS